MGIVVGRSFIFFIPAVSLTKRLRSSVELKTQMHTELLLW